MLFWLVRFCDGREECLLLAVLIGALGFGGPWCDAESRQAGLPMGSVEFGSCTTVVPTSRTVEKSLLLMAAVSPGVVGPLGSWAALARRLSVTQ